MSILISGIDMPRLGMVINIYADGRVTNHYDEQFETIATAVTVPPHGRLIDADALEAHGDCLSRLHVDFDAPSGRKVWRECVPFDDIPTVIPAEEETT